VYVPVGSIIIGEGWSQIMGTGSYFEDGLNPKVIVQVSAPGDSAIIQISDMLFTVKGPTAGAILMQWNVHEPTQGSGKLEMHPPDPRKILTGDFSCHVGFSLPCQRCKWNRTPGG
jgi:hypothetical protein